MGQEEVKEVRDRRPSLGSEFIGLGGGGVKAKPGRLPMSGVANFCIAYSLQNTYNIY